MEALVLITKLLPVAIDLTTRIVDYAQQAKDDGIEIPDIPELKLLNDKLKQLKDLE